METSDSKTEGWSKNFKLLQSQLQVKKAALTQAKVRTGPGQERASPLSSFKLALCPLAGYVEKSGWARGGELIASPGSWKQQDHSWSGN